jgi:hypothetical protein
MPNPSSAYAKTEKGREEIERRRYGLSPRSRSVLIVLDGKTPLGLLAERYSANPHFFVEVEALLDQGFIAEATAGSTRTASGTSDASTGDQRAQLIELARGLLGKHAQPVVARIEKCGKAAEELMACLESCHKLIRLTIDEAKAEQFVQRGRRLLAGA